MDAFLSALLRGDRIDWPFVEGDAAQKFLSAASRHRVRPLIARQLRRGFLSNAPPSVQQALARAAVQQAAAEQRLAAEVSRVVEALARAGVPTLLMKGTGIAYTHYPHPCLRPRSDTDLLIRARDVATASRLLTELQYEPLDMTRGDLLLYQRTYVNADPLGIRHVYDVHWKIAAPQLVADLVHWEALEASARPVPALGSAARTLGDAHALLLACVHRMAHHYDCDDLLWLFDIHMLASSLDARAADTFGRVAADGAAAAMCARGLALAQARFGTALPGGMEQLQARVEGAVARFDGGSRMLDVVLSDLKALPGWRRRLRLLRQHLIPPGDYIRRRYGRSHPLVVPFLYAHRIVTGAPKWLRPLGGRPAV